MDRQIVYPGSIPFETDILNSNKYSMVGLGLLALDLLGSSTLASGLACTPTAPASLNVQIAPGRLYSLQNIDNTPYSSLAADTTHQIIKQGILADALTIGCAAPGTFGFSINYLIQAAYQDIDTNLAVLPYYDATNPSQPFSGPNNLGASQATARKGTVVISAKPGTAAATGTQTTPAADTGFVGLWVVTVANGQSTITAASISLAPSAPFMGSPLDIQAFNVIRSLAGLITGMAFGNAGSPINYAFRSAAGGAFTIPDENGVQLSAGYKGYPPHPVSGNYITTLADRGKLVQMTDTSSTQTVTLGNAAAGYSFGDLVVVSNVDTSQSKSLAASAGEVLTWNGSHGTRTLGAAGCAFCWRASGTVWQVLAGTGMS